MDAILHAVRSTIISSTGRRRRLALLTCLLPLVLLTSGCAHLANWKHNGFKVGPNYCQPAAPYADEYLDAYDQRISADLHGHEEWWTVFNDPDMSRLVYTSYEQNLPLRVAGMRVLEARAQRGIAVGSFFPQAQTISGEYSRTQLSKLTFPGNLPGAARAGSLWNTSFDASWEIDLWGKFRRNIESADANYDASIEDYDAILVCLLTDTASTYVGYRTFQERLRYARKNVEIQEGSLSIAQTRFDNGATSELDVTQAKTILQNTRELIPLFENQLRISNNLLCVLLGIPPADLAGELGNEPIQSRRRQSQWACPPTCCGGAPTYARQSGKSRRKVPGSAWRLPICSPTFPFSVRSATRHRGWIGCSPRRPRQGRSRPDSPGIS